MTEHVGGYRYDLETVHSLSSLREPSRYIRDLLTTDVEIPDRLSYRDKLPVLNQGQEGSCNGYAIRAVACVNHMLATGGDFREFSGDGAYYACQMIDGIKSDQGSTVSGGIRMQLNVGVMTAEDFPMTPTYDPRRMPANYKELASPYRCARAAALRTVREIEEWLGRGYGGVWWGCRWGFAFDGAGNAVRWTPSGGGHATAILGYDRRRKVVECLNSWGASWQGRGWFTVPYETLERVMSDGYTVVAGASDMAHIKPRKVDWVKESINA
jgi:hypothetical protein